MNKIAGKPYKTFVAFLIAHAFLLVVLTHNNKIACTFRPFSLRVAVQLFVGRKSF
jgi:hypothetical protein